MDAYADDSTLRKLWDSPYTEAVLIYLNGLAAGAFFTLLIVRLLH